MNYKNLFIIYILLFIKICKIYSEKITLNFLLYSFYDTNQSYYRLFTDAFNEYSIANNLDIKVELDVLSPNTSSETFEDYGNKIEQHVLYKSTEHDLFFYYSNYLRKYGDHLVDLKDYLQDEHFKGIDKRLLEETCTSNSGEIVGYPLIMYVSTLFSNQELLKKYGKSVPKTWEELMKTSKYIVDEEKKENNEYLRYNGLFNDYDASVTVYEYIHSYRESNNSTHPDLRSEATMEALKDLKQMINEIGKDIVRYKNNISLDSLMYGNKEGIKKFVFIRYFYGIHSKIFKGSTLPGRKRGVSGAIVIPNNIGINKYISDERKKAAAEYLKFITKKENQIEYLIRNDMLSSNLELYDDDQVCEMMECDIIKDALPLSFMGNNEKYFGNDKYHKEYSRYMHDYLFGDESLPDVLKKLDDVTKIYKYSLNTDDSFVGILVFFIFVILFISVGLSIVFIFIKKLANRFKFLSKNQWAITILGTLILMSSILTLYGNVTNAKCHLRVTLINVGFVLSVSPSLLKLIKNFPVMNKTSVLFNKNKYMVIIVITVVMIILTKIFSMSSYTIDDIEMSSGGHYLKCNLKSTFGRIIYCIILIYDFIIIVISLVLIYIEWSLRETSLDVKYLATALFMDSLSLILLVIFDSFEFKHYIIYNTLLAINILLFALLNHVFIYLVRILSIFRPSNQYDDPRKILGKLSKNPSSSNNMAILSHNKFPVLSSSYNDPGISSFSKFTKVSTSYNKLGYYTNNSNNYEFTSSSNSTLSNDTKLTKFTKKIMNYHNQTDVTSY